MISIEKFKTILILGLVVVIGTFFLGDTTTAQKSKTQFEYHVRVGTLWSPRGSPGGAVYNGIDPKAVLDQLGDDGWELVTIEPASELNYQHVLYIFRRPKRK